MFEHVLVDTGPLVAIISDRDGQHARCVDQLRQIAPPLLTCWPVITEAAWLLRGNPAHVQRLLGSLDAGFLKLLPLDETSASAIARYVGRYASLGLQLADASLAVLAEREKLTTIFTLDRRDFSVVRVRGRALRLLL